MNNLSKITVTCLFIGTVLSSYGQSYAKWRHPLPQGNTLTGSYFINENVGYVVGDYGNILKTINAGIDWIALESTSTAPLRSVHFPSLDTGFVVGLKGTILRTTDGGNTWENISISTSERFYDVYFITTTLGFVVGSNSSTILKTENGGDTWQRYAGSKPSEIRSITFIDDKTGYATGYTNNEGGTIIKTTDGGNTWVSYFTGLNDDYYDVAFYDTQNGIAVGGNTTGRNTYIRRTTNGGTTWSSINVSSTVQLLSVKYLSENELIAIGYNSLGTSNSTTVLKSINGGLTWTQLNIDHTTFFNSIQYVYDNKLLTFGRGVHQSTNAGITWEAVNTNANNNLNDIAFNTSEIGLAIGNYGTALKTIDGGNSWETFPLNTSAHLLKMEFTSPKTGYIAGSNGLLLKTTDSAKVFTEIQIDLTTSIRGLYFINDSVGYVGSDKGAIFYTRNGGLTWENRSINNTTRNVTDIFFRDSLNGYVAINEMSIYKTNDAGKTWIKGINNGSYPINAIQYTSEKTGYYVGNTSTIRKDTIGNSFFTTKLYPKTSTNYNDIFFMNSDTGFLVGGSNFSGLPYISNSTIEMTVNGGISWTKLATINATNVNAITLKNDSTLFICGENGSIISIHLNDLPKIEVSNEYVVCDNKNHFFTIPGYAGYRWYKNQTDVIPTSSANGIYLIHNELTKDTTVYVANYFNGEESERVAVNITFDKSPITTILGESEVSPSSIHAYTLRGIGILDYFEANHSQYSFESDSEVVITWGEVEAETNISLVTSSEKGCVSDTLVYPVLISETVGLNKQFDVLYNIHPNPTNSEIYLDEEIKEWAVYTIQGVLVLAKSTSTKIDVSTLYSGIYILQYTVDGQEFLARFVKN